MDEVQTESYQLEGVYEKGDLKTLNRALWLASVRWPFRVLLWVLLVVYVIAWLSFVVTSVVMWDVNWAGGYMIVGLPAFFVVIRHYRMKMLVHWWGDYVLRQTSRVFWKDGWVGCRCHGHERRADIKQVTGGIFREKFVYVAIDNGLFFVFPRRFFIDDVQWDAFRLMLYRHVGQCAKCGYLLKGSVSDGCPECGDDLMAQVRRLTV
ncbi:hypothetical protein [Poriferisphaera sp. WC338]|uniref:hypothetical protein n=1 Tax=Poriferisphaera sp. WC338 TaxID=3425129 RepID=UPI003D81C201